MKRLIPALALLTGPAMAQPPQQPPTPEAQAMGATIMSCVQEGVALRTEIFRLQAELAALKARPPAAPDAPK